MIKSCLVIIECVLSVEFEGVEFYKPYINRRPLFSWKKPKNAFVPGRLVTPIAVACS